jgi:hypothetical protein
LPRGRTVFVGQGAHFASYRSEGTRHCEGSSPERRRVSVKAPMRGAIGIAHGFATLGTYLTHLPGGGPVSGPGGGEYPTTSLNDRRVLQHSKFGRLISVRVKRVGWAVLACRLHPRLRTYRCDAAMLWVRNSPLRYGLWRKVMTETRKLAAILAADVVGYSRLAGADEDRTLARLWALRSDLIDMTIAVHHGRVVKRTGDGSLVEFA